jgi:hypothetical protein
METPQGNDESARRLLIQQITRFVLLKMYKVKGEA